MNCIQLVMLATLVSCSSRSDPPPPSPDILGAWVGEWSSDFYPDGGQFGIVVRFDGAQVEGDVQFSPYPLWGAMSGRQTGYRISFATEATEFVGDVTGGSMRGTFEVVAGPFIGDRGQWSVDRGLRR